MRCRRRWGWANQWVAMIDPDFERRLENWGAYFRPERDEGVASTTYEVCRHMAIEAGRTIRDGYRELQPAPEIDEDDARIIEWCWGQSRYRMDAKHWALLRAHYVMRHDSRMLCRAMQIRWRSFEAELGAAAQRFGQCVQLLEGCGKISSKTF